VVVVEVGEDDGADRAGIDPDPAQRLNRDSGWKPVSTTIVAAPFRSTQKK
jgi:hypothetical protein